MVLAFVVLLVLAGCSSSSKSPPHSEGKAPSSSASDIKAARHVLVVVLENKSYAETWGPSSPAPYLAHDLRSKGTLLTNYYAIGHASLANYVAMISGQAPDEATGGDCIASYSAFVPTGRPDASGQVPGDGCVLPASVQTLAGQLTAKGLTWRGYLEDMGDDPGRDGGTACAHPTIGSPDSAVTAEPDDGYATRHNPFVYFRSIIDDHEACTASDVSLDHLVGALAHPSTAPNFALIVPNLCDDGHDVTCAGKNLGGTKTGGLAAVNAWLEEWIPKILASPTYEQGNTSVVITFDEAEGSDSTACCNEQPGPNQPQPGLSGPGGGRTGALVISPFVTPGASVATPYNHYSLLRSIEDVFGLSHLGFAGADGLAALGPGLLTRS